MNHLRMNLTITLMSNDSLTQTHTVVMKHEMMMNDRK